MYNNQSQRTSPGRGRGTHSRNHANYANGRNAGMGQQQADLNDSHQDSMDLTQAGQQQATPQPSREPQHTGCYVVIPPNESRREKLQRVANQELEEWERFKEARRLGPVKITPGKVGGYVPETETRQRQQMVQSQSRYQKMLQKEDYKKKQKAEEDAQIQKMKDIQRQKAEKLELKKRQEEQSRQIQWQEDKFLRNHAFLDQLSPGENNYRTDNRCETEPSASAKRESYKQQSKQEEERQLQYMKEEQRRKSELLELKQRQEEEQRRTSQQDHHRRVNNAFLDRLERKNTSNPNQDRYCGLSNAWN
ncbi:epithelial-stromal interaction protein 1 [Pelobates fuscus]|uniref:epithelial-stromal interaction protein 1 n=1 Tax=Pelobates fuscus TaxID=191477 RepID=UPI002FE43455